MRSVTDSREHQHARQCNAVKKQQPLQPEVADHKPPQLRFRLNNQRRAYETALDMASALGGGSKWPPADTRGQVNISKGCSPRHLGLKTCHPETGNSCRLSVKILMPVLSL